MLVLVFHFTVLVLVTGKILVFKTLIKKIKFFTRKSKIKRCKIPLINDTFEIQNDQHANIVDRYIPFDKNLMTKNNYDRCQIRLLFSNETGANLAISDCDEWVFSKEYFDHTIVTDVSIYFKRLFFIFPLSHCSLYLQVKKITLNFFHHFFLVEISLWTKSKKSTLCDFVLCWNV